MPEEQPPRRWSRRFDDLSLRWKLLATFGAILLLMVGMLAAALLTIVAYQSTFNWVQHSLETVALASEMNSWLARAQSAYRGYLLTGDETFIEMYETNLDLTFEQLRQLETAESSHDPAQAERWRAIGDQIAERRQSVVEPAIARRQQVSAGAASLEDVAASMASDEDQAEVAAIRAIIEEAERYEQAFLAARTAEAENSISFFIQLRALGAVVLVGVGLFLAFHIVRDITNPIARLSAVAQEIAAGKLDRRIGLRRGDELGQMAASFDRMADRVQTLVHDQAEALRTVREHEAVMQAVLDSVAVGILMIDPAGKVVIVNQPACDLLGVSADTIFTYEPARLQTLVGELFNDPRRVAETVGREAFESDATLTTVFDQEAPVSRHLEVYTAPVWSRAGERLGRIFALRDVTREREVDRMKTEFVSLVSHELRTPLTSIKGYVDLLREGEVGPLSEEQAGFLEIVASSTDRLVALINDLLDISRIEAGKIELKRERLDLGAQIRTVAAVFGPQVTAKDQRLELAVPDEALTVVGDADRITQILTNLLSNAHKYTPAGGVIGVAAAVRGDNVAISVRDTGIGLSAAEQALLFTRFYRAPHRAVQEAGGTGLGLTITRSLVELHGGTITVSSVPGQGSTFTVTLPLVHERSEVEAAPVGAGQRILVVEDEPDIGNLLRRYLRRAGYQVAIAATAEDGLRQAQALDPDLITLDIYLPDVDGFTLLDWLRHDPTTRDIPVLLISVSPDEGQGQLLGAVGHLTKPVDEATLLSHVQEILAPEGACIILVADDDAASRQVLVRMLRRAGHRTIEASGGAAAIAAARAAKRLDLALIDVRMPGTDGLAALRALRGNQKTRALPIVMMTASTGAESSRSDIEALGATLVTKPLAAAALVDVVASVLDRRVP